MEFTVDGLQVDPSSNALAIPEFEVFLRWPPDAPAFEVEPRIVPEPVIFTPLPETMKLGADLSLVAATFPGTPASYQWSFNGTNLVGATNLSLSLKPLSAAHSGTYTVTASNDIGSLTSAPMVLSVTGETLRVTRSAVGMALSWDSPAATLESAPTSSGPWQTIEGASAPWPLPHPATEAYFRLRF